MMTENNAAQPGLTELRQALNTLADHEKSLSYVKSKGYDTDKAERCVQAAQERVDALLSKLRAEGVLAGDERETFEEWDRLFTAYCGAAQGVDAGKAANALVAFTRAALASAPVAGEAQPPRPNDQEIEEIVKGLGMRWDGSRWVLEDADLHPLVRALLYRYTAAPQASEAVRLDEDAERWRWATAVDDNAETLHSIVMCHGGDQQKINERADFYRAGQADKDGGDCAKGAGDVRTWQRLTDSERDGFVGELVDYGTDFVSPLYAVVESIERRLCEKNASQTVVKQSLTATQTGEKGVSE